MQNDLDELTKKAVRAAIDLDWTLARDLNLNILELEPNNIDAKIRLGKAYLELHNYAKAKKCFKEVLAVDPINPVAKKNLELAKEEKHLPVTSSRFVNMISEPATSILVPAEIVARGFTGSKLAIGANLELKIFSQMAKLIYTHKNQEINLAVITEPKIVKKLKTGKDKGATFTASFAKGQDKSITVQICSSLPIFDSERQELKPYTKRDFLESDNESEPVLEEN